ncbi:DNA-processing protein DprA [Microbacterium foliorum]|uniref:DNA-processing protein DprA n=1 Tax=Microbacterium foliorum TaxID=104336 RepID=UPI001D9468FD|nr:DNA-processing protein DprA [Microbacterium foliorum]CAH0123935.1 Putative DNA processing protein DprA [Microbacterium foliorum]
MIDELRSDGELVSAMAAVRSAAGDLEALARVAWSVVAEPGDGVAGALVQALGASEALRVALDDGVGPVPGRGGAELAEGRARWRVRAEVRAVAAAVRAAGDVQARLLIPGDPEWPHAVDDLGAHAPMVLWVRGDASLLSAAPRVAIVGARAASGYGEMLAGDFAGELAASGAVIVSGGAYGIDGAAHRAALGVEGRTIAFLAGGVDRAYPQGHRQLLQRIVATGAVVSEVPCGTAPTNWRFLARNRLIAALADATVVVEAGWRSGSLNTAGHAAALGRPLGAVPGPVTSAASAGCHRLLREYDARCVTTSEEIRELWGISGYVEGSAQEGPGVDPERRRLRDALGVRTPSTVTELARRSGLAPTRVSALLGLLELEGDARRADGGWLSGHSDRR